MKKIISILLVFISIYSYSQTIRFNKYYYPLNTDLSDVYNIISTDTGYLCYGVGIIQNLYPQSLLAFNIDVNGNLQSSKLFGDTNIVGYCIGESIIIILLDGKTFYINLIVLILLLQSLFIQIQ